MSLTSHLKIVSTPSGASKLSAKLSKSSKVTGMDLSTLYAILSSIDSES